MRFTLIVSSLIVVLLLSLFAFLLFRTAENQKIEVEEATPRVIETETQLFESENISPTTDVSRSSTTVDERGLGTDINMEFPTLEE